jgi:hypothetical protein
LDLFVRVFTYFTRRSCGFQSASDRSWPPATKRRPCSALETGAISTPASRSVVPLITRRQPSTVRPQRPCNVPYFARRDRDTRADRAPRPNRVASRRNVAPRGPERPHPMSRAAHRRWVRSGRFRLDATGCDSRARPSRRTRTTSERVRVSRPSASTASRPRPPASAGLLDRPSHRLGFEEPRCFFPGFAGAEGPARRPGGGDWGAPRVIDGVPRAPSPCSRAQIPAPTVAARRRSRSRDPLGPENPGTHRTHAEQTLLPIFLFPQVTLVRHHG